MRHRIFHSGNLRARLADYAARLGVGEAALAEAYDWMLANNVAFEEGDEDAPRVSIASVDIEKRIPEPLPRRFYAMLRDEVPTQLVPLFGINWPTFQDRWLRLWEQVYNMLINKLPSHTLRLCWLRLGGAKIGKGSSIWRNTEVLGVNNLVMGEDSCIAWHCQIDARAGLIIGDHVAVASYAKIIAGSHDLAAPEFWSVSAPIYIDDYAWIATGALIGHGARIGRGAVVTANTVVGKEVAPYKIVGGLGAKPMGERPRDLNYRVGGKGLFTLLH
ncbi:acetyltransferase [Chromobacterium violaceum]|nr:acetyltransferase [Chromobacterium violaceum]KMN85823.1 acetyltransferase [Chromobacterium violaceum]KMN91128.1 acetyltransferase [Chromobacterium violaceum]KMO02336.1 acetyltransferase [Chromobacterium violaceum]OQS09023.1 acetyltransferase [Chromobacterium violaceum]